MCPALARHVQRKLANPAAAAVRPMSRSRQRVYHACITAIRVLQASFRGSCCGKCCTGCPRCDSNDIAPNFYSRVFSRNPSPQQG
ncbi:hypothetical protein VTK56DRAFT_3772 [Thermocarpiscus australiensis]